MVARLGLGGRDIPDRLEKATFVEPVDPFEGGELDRFEAAPGARPMDHLGFVEAVDGFCGGIVPPVPACRPGRAWPARGQAPLSPTLPSQCSMPASASRSVYLIETYCTPRSLWWT